MQTSEVQKDSEQNGSLCHDSVKMARNGGITTDWDIMERSNKIPKCKTKCLSQ